MHWSIMGILGATLMPLSFPSAIDSFESPFQLDFESFGSRKKALFVTMGDLDHSLDLLTGLFVRQAIRCLCDTADAADEGRLAVPTRFVLDDFANLKLDNFDSVLSVIRSREISCTLVCQTVSQLEDLYGAPAANSVIGNCDRQLILGFQDESTARYFSTRADKTASALLRTPRDRWWLFERGRSGVCDDAYRLEGHPAHDEFRKLREDDRERREIECAHAGRALGKGFAKGEPSPITFGDHDLVSESERTHDLETVLADGSGEDDWSGEEIDEYEEMLCAMERGEKNSMVQAIEALRKVRVAGK